MQPSQIFVSTRSRREYPRRRGSVPVLPVSVLVVVAFFAWALAVLVLGWGAL